MRLNPNRAITKQDCIIYEEGMIEAWKHIQNICRLCIKAHKEEIRRLKGKKGI
jgi:hypothetical protein